MSSGVIPTLGQVTTRKGARWHLNTAGTAHCHAGRNRILPDTTRDLTSLATAAGYARVCRTCRPAIQNAIATASTVIANSDTRCDETTLTALARVADALMTPAARADRDTRHAALIARHTAAPRPVDPRQALWDEWDAFMTNPDAPLPAALTRPTPNTITVVLGRGVTVQRPVRALSPLGQLKERYAATLN